MIVQTLQIRFPRFNRSATLLAPFLGLALLIALMGGLVGCDSETGPSPQGLFIKVLADSSGGDPFAGVDYLVVSAEGEDLTTKVFQVVPYVATGTIALEPVPYGVRRILIEGWAASATGELTTVISRGRSTDLTVAEGAAPQAASVLFARVNTVLDFVSAEASAPQTLNAGRVGQTVTAVGSGRFVVAGGSVPVDGQSWWTPEGVGTSHKLLEMISERAGSNGGVSDTNGVLAAMAKARSWHASSVFSDTLVCSTGGILDGGNVTKSAEVLYSTTGSVANLTATMAKARYGHGMVLLDPETFTFVIFGGDTDGDGTWELWNPQTGSQGASPLPGGARRFAAVTKFDVPDRDAPAWLIAGGESDTGVLSSALIFDPTVTPPTFIVIDGGLPKGGRTMATATYVPGRGFIYVVGGYTAIDRSAASTAIDVYDTKTLAFLPAAATGSLKLKRARGAHGAARLDGNAVLIAGGGDGSGSLDSLEFIYEYLTPNDQGSADLTIDVIGSCDTAGCPPVPFLDAGRLGVTAVGFDSGMGLILGGASGSPSAGWSTPKALKLYNPPSL